MQSNCSNFIKTKYIFGKRSETKLYYSVLIEVSEETWRKKEIPSITLTDQPNMEKIKTEIIIPYINKEEFFIDGYCLKKSEITRIKIVSSERSIREIINIEYAKLGSGIICVINESSIISHSKLVQNITNEILSEVKKELDNTKKQSTKTEPSSINRKVFIVHGHDDKLKLEVETFIYKLGLEAIVLSEQVNKGKTIIEKIEENTDVGYGIVLYTPCDKGGTAETQYDDMKFRARQNVIFEHGYLIGKLGRNRVCALVDGDIEYPSDINGIVYIPYQGQWKHDIEQELKSIGYEIK